MPNPIMSQIQVSGMDYDICDLEGRLKLKDLENAISTNQKILGEQGTAYAIYDSDTNTLTFFRANETYTSSDTSATDIMGNSYTGTIYTDIEDYTAPPVPWDDVKTNIKKIVIADSQYIVPKSCTEWFSDTPVEEFKNISQLDFKYTTDLSYMFANCTNLITLPDLSEWDTSNITNMAHMFDGCGATNFKSISKWDTSNVTNMSNMFNSSNLGSDKESYIFNWDTSSVIDFSNMFANYGGTGLYKISGWDTSAAKNMAGMFQNCPDMTSLSLGQNWDTNNVTNMDNMFNNCPELTLDCSSWNVDNVISHIDFAKNSPDVIEPNWIVTYTYAVLDSEGTLTFFRSANNYTAGTNQTVTDIKGNSYTGQVYTGIKNTGMSDTSVPWYSQRSSVKLARIANGQVIAPKSCAYWFSDCSNMTAFEGAERLDTSAVTSMYYMFYNCSAMTEPPLVGGWNLGAVTSMGGMFNDCSAMTEPPVVSNWDTSTVTNMSTMFQNCMAMTNSPSVGSWDTSAVTNLWGMFNGCSAMTEAPAVGNWDTSAVTNMSATFQSCSAMTNSPSVGSWDTSAVTDMSFMFSCCKSMTEPPLVGSWNTNVVTNMRNMFQSCLAITSLDVGGWDFSRVTDSWYYLGLRDCLALKELKVSAGAKIADLPEHAAQDNYLATWSNTERGITSSTAVNLMGAVNAGNGAGTWKWEKVILISQGGTGATTDVNARANLNVYSKSEVDTALDSKADKTHAHSTNDITSGTLPITHGGTGKTNAADARIALGAASQTDLDTLRDSVSQAITTKSTTGPAYGPLLSVTANGHAEQDGTPTPSDPKEIMVVRGRNLLDESSVANLYPSADSTLMPLSDGISYIVPCKPLTTYTFRRSTLGTAPRGIIVESNEYPDANVSYTRLKVNETLMQATFTTSATAKYIVLFLDRFSANKGTEYQLELGSTVHPYVPYGHVGLDVTADGTTTTTPIPLPSRGWVGSLPDGTHDALSIDGAGKVTWELADAVVRVSDLSFDYDSTNQRFLADMTALGVRGIGTSRLVPMLSDSFAAKWHGEAYDASWDGVAYIGGQNLVLHARAYDNVTDFENALANTSFYYPLATATTESMGYVDLPDIPDGAVVSMPELEGLGVESWAGDAVARYVRAWVARSSVLLPAELQSNT